QLFESSSRTALQASRPLLAAACRPESRPIASQAKAPHLREGHLHEAREREGEREDLAIFRQSARRFFERECAPHVARWDKQGVVDREVWTKAGEAGLLCP